MHCPHLPGRACTLFSFQRTALPHERFLVPFPMLSRCFHPLYHLCLPLPRPQCLLHIWLYFTSIAAFFFPRNPPLSLSTSASVHQYPITQTHLFHPKCKFHAAMLGLDRPILHNPDTAPLHAAKLATYTDGSHTDCRTASTYFFTDDNNQICSHNHGFITGILPIYPFFFREQARLERVAGPIRLDL